MRAARVARSSPVVAGEASAPSSSPSTATTRNGTPRSGVRVENVIAPRKKSGRLATPLSKSASNRLMSLSSSKVVLGWASTPTTAAVDISVISLSNQSKSSCSLSTGPRKKSLAALASRSHHWAAVWLLSASAASRRSISKASATRPTISGASLLDS